MDSLKDWSSITLSSSIKSYTSLIISLRDSTMRTRLKAAFWRSGAFKSRFTSRSSAFAWSSDRGVLLQFTPPRRAYGKEL